MIVKIENLLLLITFCCIASIVFAKDTNKIGVILPLTGEVSSVAGACQNGMTLAMENLPGALSSKINLIYEDDQNQPKNTVSAFTKLVKVNKVDAIVTFTSSTSKAISPLADQFKIPTIAVAADFEVVKNREHIVTFWVSPLEEAKELLKEAKNRGYKRIAMITSIHNGVLVIKKGLISLNNGQLEIVLDEEYPAEAKNFRTFLSKVKSKKGLDAIFVNLYYGATGIFARQAREMGINLPLINVESFEDPEQVKLSAGALIGQWYVQADDPSGQFMDSYLKKFPGASTYSAGNCYDIVMLIAESIRKREELNYFLHNVKDFNGALGTFSASGDNRFTLPATVKVVTKDGFEKLKRQ